VDIPDFDAMQMILIHSYFHFHTHSYNYLVQTQPGEAKTWSCVIVLVAKLHVSCTDCSGEPVCLLVDSGAELEDDEVESDSGVSGSELKEATERFGSVGEGDLESGGDGWLGTQMYQAKEALSRRTLNFPPVLLLTALRFSSFSIFVLMLCPPFSSFWPMWSRTCCGETFSFPHPSLKQTNLL